MLYMSSIRLLGESFGNHPRKSGLVIQYNVPKILNIHSKRAVKLNYIVSLLSLTHLKFTDACNKTNNVMSLVEWYRI